MGANILHRLLSIGNDPERAAHRSVPLVGVEGTISPDASSDIGAWRSDGQNERGCGSMSCTRGTGEESCAAD